ncbi:type III-B CRISPR module RAMP protein Cmr1 [Synergistales bacterium]|nr:type III-B CRISPR module RAMP protein Cmr1 [Synergistales bacterium]
MPADTAFAAEERIEHTFGIQLITPMYGGGARTGVNDPDFPVRPASVRGQLRFWWRATRGAKFETVKELHKRESEIWGKTDTPSSVVVRVKPSEWKERRPYVGPKDDNYGFKRFSPEGYVLFPATADTSRHDLVREGLAFEVSVSFAKSKDEDKEKGKKRDEALKKDIFCAVWAWVNFGGLGSRTRRGCGALFCKELAPERAAKDSVSKWFRESVNEYGLEPGANRLWPTLSGRILAGSSSRGPGKEASLEAWKMAITPMKDFRQTPGIGRNNVNSATRRPGRSFWPEPDTLRREFGLHAQNHAPSDDMPDGFPRAAFGLPIIFQFVGSRGDPSTELYPKGKRRMGSPLILRPLNARDGGSLPVVVLLQSPMCEELELKNLVKTFGKESIVNKKFVKYRNSPMKNSTNGSAVEAFTAYLKTRSFEEV